MQGCKHTHRIANYFVEIYVLVEGYHLAQRCAACVRDERAADREKDKGDVDVQADSGALCTDEGAPKDCASCGSV